jgi:hypothetical protein
MVSAGRDRGFRVVLGRHGWLIVKNEISLILVASKSKL